MAFQVKPNMNNSKDMQVFATAKEAVQFLEEYTGGTSSVKPMMKKSKSGFGSKKQK